MADITICVNRNCIMADNCYRHSLHHDKQTVWQSYTYLDCFGASEFKTENYYVPIKEITGDTQ